MQSCMFNTCAKYERGQLLKRSMGKGQLGRLKEVNQTTEFDSSSHHIREHRGHPGMAGVVVAVVYYYISILAIVYDCYIFMASSTQESQSTLLSLIN